MENTSEHIKDIQLRLQKFVKQYKALQKENERQSEMLIQLQAEKHQLNDTIDDLKQQNLILKASLDAMDPGDKKDLEKKLTLYIRNIDKCITILSNP